MLTIVLENYRQTQNKDLVKVFYLFLDRGAPVNLQLDLNPSANPLFIACSNCNRPNFTQFAQALVKKGAIIPPCTSHFLWSRALEYKNIDIAKLITDLGQDLEAVVYVYPNGYCTALQKSIIEHDMELARFLLEKKANPNNMKGWNKSPLKIALESGYHDMVELLLHYQTKLIDV